MNNEVMVMPHLEHSGPGVFFSLILGDDRKADVNQQAL